jgi:NAD(P)-dependent dehydrogenase (short-subunit alcohol dehydrogenase family)
MIAAATPQILKTDPPPRNLRFAFREEASPFRFRASRGTVRRHNRTFVKRRGSTVQASRSFRGGKQTMFAELFDLRNRTVLITGGSRGLGLDIATAAVELGANLILVARSAEGLAAAKAQLDAPGDRVRTIAADIADLNAIAGLVDEARGLFGRIDVLVNNAGIALGSPAETFPIDKWQRVMDVNLNAPFFLAAEVARTCMIPMRSGKILNIASVGGLIGNAPQLGMKVAAYNVSKGGLISATRALASEWGTHNINVNALCPGFFATDMTKGHLDYLGPTVLPTIPLGRFGGKADLVGPALLLMTEAGRHITGETLVVDGGMISAS